MPDAFDRVRPTAKLRARVGPDSRERAYEDLGINGHAVQAVDVVEEDGSVTPVWTPEHSQALEGVFQDRMYEKLGDIQMAGQMEVYERPGNAEGEGYRPANADEGKGFYYDGQFYSEGGE